MAGSVKGLDFQLALHNGQVSRLVMTPPAVCTHLLINLTTWHTLAITFKWKRILYHINLQRAMQWQALQLETRKEIS